MSNRYSTTIILFGATGDLARRKLYPALYKLYKTNPEVENFAVIGVARRPYDHEKYRETVKESIEKEVDNPSGLNAFLERFHYYSHDVDNIESYVGLKDLADKLDHVYQLSGNRIFYLALSPSFFGTVTLNLKQSGLTDTNGWKRLVIEKPFGHNLSSAQQLNNEIRHVFDEDEIYRIDHYLGKEMIQNIQVIRFANPIFEYIWNNRYIANVQITASETVGVGERAGYYDKTGALMDMVQNHIMQMVALTAMEPPARLETEDIRDEKVKVLKSIRTIDESSVKDHVIRGQYTAGNLANENVIGYRDEHDIEADSDTETFVAAKLFIDNFRWAGVPFYIRTGKRMPVKSTEIVIQFKESPLKPYFKGFTDLEPNLLVIHVQPDEGISLKMNAKKFSTSTDTMPISMEFSNNFLADYGGTDAYQRLLYDSIRGDSTNFTRWDEVALSWQLVDGIIGGWKKQSLPVQNYAAGTMGPQAAFDLLAKDGFQWWPLNKIDRYGRIKND